MKCNFEVTAKRINFRYNPLIPFSLYFSSNMFRIRSHYTPRLSTSKRLHEIIYFILSFLFSRFFFISKIRFRSSRKIYREKSCESIRSFSKVSIGNARSRSARQIGPCSGFPTATNRAFLAGLRNVDRRHAGLTHLKKETPRFSTTPATTYVGTCTARHFHRDRRRWRFHGLCLSSLRLSRKTLGTSLAEFALGHLSWLQVG